MRAFFKTSNQAFSLIELMVVIAIIGLLSALAIPKFRVFQAKARQSEAKTNLSYIFALEESYFGDQDTYAALDNQGKDYGCTANTLGFVLSPCKARYNYSVDANGTTFITKADSGQNNAIMPGCDKSDIWTINELKELVAVSDSVTLCQ